MALLETAVVASDWLKHESDNYHSRSTALIASGQGKLKSGTVLGRLTANGKYVVAANTGSDGSQIAYAILLSPVDATSADASAVVIDTHADVSHNGLTWGSTINDATKRATGIGQLRDRGIKVREGA